MTTALAVYVPPEPDAGMGLTLCGRWLVSTPRARRVRWLAPWCQTVLCETWNIAFWVGPQVWKRVLTPVGRWFYRFNRRDPRYLLTLGLAGVIWWSTRLDPWVFPLVWGAIGCLLGLLWVIGPLWNAPSPKREEWR